MRRTKAPTMLELARILAAVSMFALVLAIAAGLSPSGRRNLLRLDGGVTADDGFLHIGAYLLFAAVGFGAAAAGLAAGWFAT